MKRVWRPFKYEGDFMVAEVGKVCRRVTRGIAVKICDDEHQEYTTEVIHRGYPVGAGYIYK